MNITTTYYLMCVIIICGVCELGGVSENQESRLLETGVAHGERVVHINGVMYIVHCAIYRFGRDLNTVITVGARSLLSFIGVRRHRFRSSGRCSGFKEQGNCWSVVGQDCESRRVLGVVDVDGVENDAGGCQRSGLDLSVEEG